MKSYFLAPIASRSTAVAALNSALSGGSDQWLLKDNAGDVVAYFSLVESDNITGLRTIQVDISGRHYNSDVEVIAVLNGIRESTGGEVTDDA